MLHSVYKHEIFDLPTESIFVNSHKEIIPMQSIV